MRLLCDTHLLIWASTLDREGLNRRAPLAYDLINDPATEPLFSTASLWEIVIKASTGRSNIGIQPAVLRRGLLQNGWIELPVTGEHALAVGLLPPLHKDPFDRLLVAQASVEGVMLATSDPMVASYPGPIRRV